MVENQLAISQLLMNWKVIDPARFWAYRLVPCQFLCFCQMNHKERNKQNASWIYCIVPALSLCLRRDDGNIFSTVLRYLSNIVICYARSSYITRNLLGKCDSESDDQLPRVLFHVDSSLYLNWTHLHSTLQIWPVFGALILSNVSNNFEDS